MLTYKILCTSNIYTGKNGTALKSAVTLSNHNRFSQFVQCWKAHDISNKVQIILTTTP